MKVIAFNGSARKDGNTAILINYVLTLLSKIDSPYVGRETAYSLHSVPFAIHGSGHCGFWPFIYPDSGPKCAAQRTSRPPANRSEQAT